MTTLSLRSSDNPGVKVAPHHLNMWATMYYWRDAPLIADDYARACMGTDIRWDILTLFYWLKNNFGRTPKEDVFGIGFGGSPEDTAINASLHALQKNWQTVDDLPFAGDEKEVLSLLCIKWEATAAAIVSRQTVGKPLPMPAHVEPPKPPPIVLVPHDNIPAKPEVPSAKSSWAWAKTAAGVLAGVAFVAGFFLPGWAKAILDAIIGVLRTLGAM